MRDGESLIINKTKKKEKRENRRQRGGLGTSNSESSSFLHPSYTLIICQGKREIFQSEFHFFRPRTNSIPYRLLLSFSLCCAKSKEQSSLLSWQSSASVISPENVRAWGFGHDWILIGLCLFDSRRNSRCVCRSEFHHFHWAQLWVASPLSPVSLVMWRLSSGRREDDKTRGERKKAEQLKKFTQSAESEKKKNCEIRLRLNVI